MGGEHRREDRQGDAGLVAEPRDASPARVEEGVGQGLGGQRIMPPVVVADPLAERLVARVAAELLDPGMLVGRHGLRGELAADPVGGLGHDDASAPAPAPPAPRRSLPARRPR